MGAARYYDEDELAALGRPQRERAMEAERARPVRLAHDPLCSKAGAIEGPGCAECAVILRTRIDGLRRQRALARSRANHPAGRARWSAVQLALWDEA